MSKAQASVALGFIGLGVMGEPICRHLATKAPLHDASASMIACDINHAVLDQLSVLGVTAAQNAAMLAAQADTIFLSLPSGEVVEQGSLSVMVGATRDQFGRIEPLLRFLQQISPIAGRY